MIQLNLEVMRMIRPIQREYEFEAERARLVKSAKLPKRTSPFSAKLTHHPFGFVARKYKPTRS